MVTRAMTDRAGERQTIMRKEPITVTRLVMIWATSVAMQVETTSTS